MSDYDVQVHSASKARQNLFALIESAGRGRIIHEINLRGKKSVVLVSKDDLDSWLETLDILSSPKEMAQIRRSEKEQSWIDHKDLVKSLGLDEASI